MSNATTTKRIEILDVTSRDYTRFGAFYPGKPDHGHNLTIIVGDSVRLHGIERNRHDGPKPYDLTFKVGERAEYDSYNLHYTGVIVSIGAKTVGILPDGSKKVRRLDWHEFSWRNRDFDPSAIAARNSDVMMSS